MTLREKIELELISFAVNHGKTVNGDPREYAERILDLARHAIHAEETEGKDHE